MYVKLLPEYIPALKSLEGFGHADILWWFDGCDDEENRSVLEAESPYKQGPDTMGIFATRSPQRPNPIALSVVQILYIDHEAGVIYIAYADARQGSAGFKAVHPQSGPGRASPSAGLVRPLAPEPGGIRGL